MRKNPLATAIRAVLAPEFAAFADPLHPGRILVARRGGDGRPDAKRVAAAIEQRETLDVLNPIFRDPRRTRSNGGPTESRVPWPSSPTPEGGRGQYYCARIELPPGEVPKNLGKEAP